MRSYFSIQMGELAVIRDWELEEIEGYGASWSEAWRDKEEALDRYYATAICQVCEGVPIRSITEEYPAKGPEPGGWMLIDNAWTCTRCCGTGTPLREGVDY